MWRIIHIALMLQWLAPSTVITTEISFKETPTACEDNWIFNDGFCYFFSESDDIVNPSNAGDQCNTYDAEHVTPKTQKEFSFLQSQAKLRTTYGWSLNLATTYSDRIEYEYRDPFRFNTQFGNVYFKADITAIPKFQKSVDKINKCVALHVADRASGWNKDVEISTEPCSIKLWVACQSKKSAFPKQTSDYEKWFSYDDQLFWLSGKQANQADAAAMCKNANMELITSVSDLIQALNITSDFIPWWTGFNVGQNGPETDAGVGVDFSVVSWLSDDIRYIYGNIVLLHSGNSRVVVHAYQDGLGLPYICKKRPSVEGLFGCPNLWVRAGRSCYSIYRNKYLTWFDAKKMCESRGSHLLTINSQYEKLWFQAVAARYVSSVWTSGNDIDNEGKFTWHDRTEIDTDVLSWQRAVLGYNLYNPSSECMTFNLGIKVRSLDCQYSAYFACQYELGEGESQCEDGWKKFDKTCYLLLDTDPNSYRRNAMYCRSKLDNKLARPLMVKTKRVAEFLKQAYSDSDTHNTYTDFWLGMQASGNPISWRWYDGTLVDASVFNRHDQPDNGTGEEPENCVSVNKLMHVSDDPCMSYYPFVCEKDLSPVDALSSKHDSVSSLRAFLFVPFLSAVIGLFVPCRW